MAVCIRSTSIRSIICLSLYESWHFPTDQPLVILLSLRLHTITPTAHTCRLTWFSPFIYQISPLCSIKTCTKYTQTHSRISHTGARSKRAMKESYRVVLIRSVLLLPPVRRRRNQRHAEEKWFKTKIKILYICSTRVGR